MIDQPYRENTQPQEASKPRKTNLRGLLALKNMIFKNILIQKSLYNSIFRFLLGKSQTHQFQELFPRDLPDRSLVDETCLGTDSIDLRRRYDTSLIQKNAVTFNVSETFIFADQIRTKFLHRPAARNTPAHNIGTTVLALQKNLKIGHGSFVVVR